jgi:hypothetical protein
MAKNVCFISDDDDNDDIGLHINLLETHMHCCKASHTTDTMNNS